MGKTRYGKVRVNVRQTKGLRVNGWPMPERYLDLDPLDTAPAALTGMFEISLYGWSDLPGMVLDQVDPLPMQILGIEYEAETH